MRIEIKFPQGRDFDRLISEMDKKLSVKLLRDAGRTALAPVLADMKHNAGYDETSDGPHMRDDIKIRSTTSAASRSRFGTLITFRVGPSKAHHMKAIAQEFGTVKQVAWPFVRPALDYNVNQVLSILAAEIRYGLEGQ